MEKIKNFLKSKIFKFICASLLFLTLFVPRFDLTSFNIGGETLDSMFQGRIFSSIFTFTNFVDNQDGIFEYSPAFIYLNIIVTISIMFLCVLSLIKKERYFPHLNMVLTTTLFLINLIYFIFSFGVVLVFNIVILVLIFLVFLFTLLDYIFNFKKYIDIVNGNEIIAHLIFLIVSLFEIIPLIVNNKSFYISLNYSLIMDPLLVISFSFLLIRKKELHLKFELYNCLSLVLAVLSLLIIPLFVNLSFSLAIVISCFIIFISSNLNNERTRYLINSIISICLSIFLFIYDFLLLFNLFAESEHSIFSVVYLSFFVIYLIFFTIISLRKLHESRQQISLAHLVLISFFFLFSLLIQKIYYYTALGIGLLVISPANHIIILLLASLIFLIFEIIIFLKTKRVEKHNPIKQDGE